MESIQRIKEYPNFVLIQQFKETENPPNDKNHDIMISLHGSPVPTHYSLHQ
jgi:hypothetical protein